MRIVEKPRIGYSNSSKRAESGRRYFIIRIVDYSEEYGEEYHRWREYLHPDGKWRSTTQGSSKNFPGYYASENDAQTILDRYNK